MLNKKSFTLAISLALGSLFSISTALAAAQVTPPKVCAPINEKIVTGLFDRWNASLQTKAPDQVVKNYADDAVLLPTLSNTPRTNHAEMHDYFVNFLKKNPQGHIDQRVVRFGCNWATDTGLYTFTLDNNGKPQTAKARYSYVYENIDGQWLIVHHHSSLLPKADDRDDI